MKTILKFCLALTVLQSCVTPKYIAPEHLDPQFTSITNDTIYILSLADIRKNSKDVFKKENYLRKNMLRYLSKKNYNAVFTTSEKILAEKISYEQLINYDEKIESYLGNASQRYVFLTVLMEQESTSCGIGKRAGLTISGFVFDKLNRRLLWKNVGSGSDTSFGLMAIASSGLSIDEAAYELMQGLPKRK
ncbi:MAG: hypothetical protein IPM92_04985 [Saprospiraceae bacterium]|nr:hypothetical protein [Saprospiraceae bacterium]